MRKLPYPKIKLNASALVKAKDGLTLNGSDNFRSWTGDVIYSEHHKLVQTETGRTIVSEGKIFIFHDIFPSLSQLVGEVVIKGDTYTFSGSRFYNPDGSVHHVELRLS